MTTTPDRLTDQPLTPAEIRLAQYGQRTSAWSTATYNDGTEKALHEIALGLKAEVDRLRAALAKEERMHGETIDDRDRFHDMADKLAYAVAPEEVIGEHSSMNCPWENALDLITPMAEVDKLRAELAEARANGIRYAAELVTQAFHSEPFLNYPPDFADLLQEHADRLTAAASKPTAAVSAAARP
jgi:hypothetical protein